MHAAPPFLDPTVAPRARFVRIATNAWSFGCAPLFLTGLAVSMAVAADASPAVVVAVGTFGLVATIWAVDRGRSLRGRPYIDVRLYPDAIAYTIHGGVWELVRFEELARAAHVVSEGHHGLWLERYDGEVTSLPLNYFSSTDRDALTAALAEAVPGRFEAPR